MIFHDYTACPRYDIPFNSPHEDVFHTNHLSFVQTEQITKQTRNNNMKICIVLACEMVGIAVGENKMSICYSGVSDCPHYLR